MLSVSSLGVAHRNPAFAVLFALFLSLADPLAAKCPTNFVEVRGKIDCSFKADDKVLVTLIFDDRQLEGAGVEAAIDIHEGAFDGRLAFDTYSGSFLTEDRCHRRPRSVLIRLVEADGLEKEKVRLKIASAFNYDEKLGSYAPKSGLVLHGWCQPQCCGSAPAGQNDWQKVDAGPFSILAPRGWTFHQLQGVDSFVGEFVGDGIKLTFDFGSRRYVDTLKTVKKSEYVAIHKSIAGYRAKIVSPKTSGHGLTGVYFRNVGNYALTLWGQDLTSTQQALVLKIFDTLHFGGPFPRYVNPPPPPPVRNQR